eukprot:3327168-Amphidinium_carterae.1
MSDATDAKDIEIDNLKRNLENERARRRKDEDARGIKKKPGRRPNEYGDCVSHVDMVENTQPIWLKHCQTSRRFHVAKGYCRMLCHMKDSLSQLSELPRPSFNDMGEVVDLEPWARIAVDHPWAFKQLVARATCSHIDAWKKVRRDSED